MSRTYYLRLRMSTCELYTRRKTHKSFVGLFRRSYERDPQKRPTKETHKDLYTRKKTHKRDLLCMIFSRPSIFCGSLSQVSFLFSRSFCRSLFRKQVYFVGRGKRDDDLSARATHLRSLSYTHTHTLTHLHSFLHTISPTNPLSQTHMHAHTHILS